MYIFIFSFLLILIIMLTIANNTMSHSHCYTALIAIHIILSFAHKVSRYGKNTDNFLLKCYMNGSSPRHNRIHIQPATSGKVITQLTFCAPNLLFYTDEYLCLWPHSEISWLQNGFYPFNSVYVINHSLIITKICFLNHLTFYYCLILSLFIIVIQHTNV